MIERYTITASADLVRQRFQIDVPGSYKARYNASPTQLLPVILQGSAGVSFFYWGTPPTWAKNKHVSEKLINMRAENFNDRPVNRKILKKHRCLIPADGFYAWKKVGKKTLIPYRFTLQDKSLFSMAGVWEEFENDEGDMTHTFKLITVSANAQVSAVCERMPVLFDKPKEILWMTNEASDQELISLLKPYNQEKMTHYTVSPGIHEAAMDVPSIILPVPPADQFGNLTLFD